MNLKKRFLEISFLKLFVSVETNGAYTQRVKINLQVREDVLAHTVRNLGLNVKKELSKLTVDDYSATEAQESKRSWFRGLRSLIVSAFVLAELPP